MCNKKGDRDAYDILSSVGLRPDGVMGRRRRRPGDRCGKAAITGDFVLTGDEVKPVIKALRENGIEVTAVPVTCLPSSRGSSSCTFGLMTTPSSSRRNCAPRWTSPQARRAELLAR
jgi:hypothetical protein